MQRVMYIVVPEEAPDRLDLHLFVRYRTCWTLLLGLRTGQLAVSTQARSHEVGCRIGHCSNV